MTANRVFSIAVNQIIAFSLLQYYELARLLVVVENELLKHLSNDIVMQDIAVFCLFLNLKA